MLKRINISKIIVLILILSMAFNGIAFASDKFIVDKEIQLSGYGHIQNCYDVKAKYKDDMFTIGTTGKGKRLEGLSLKLNKVPNDMLLVYRAHVQTKGDLPKGKDGNHIWKDPKDGSLWLKADKYLGTKGQAKRLEGIQMRLINTHTNDDYKGYKIEYQVHMQKYGWGVDNKNHALKLVGDPQANVDVWKSNGDFAGTKGEQRRVECIRVRIMKEEVIQSPKPTIPDEPSEEPDIPIEENIEYDVIYKQSYEVSPGVHHTSLTLADDKLIESVQLMEIDVQNPCVKVLSYSSKGEVSRLESIGCMIEELDRRGKRVVAGVNGDFFSSVGVPSGLQITDGEVITSPKNIKALMFILPDRRLKFENDVSMIATATTSDGQILDFRMVNRTRIPTHNDSAFLYNYRFGQSARTPEGGIEVIIDVGEKNDKLIAGQSVTGKVIEIKEKADSIINRGTFVISAVGDKAEWVRKNLRVGQDLTILVSFDKGVNEADQAISGNSTLGTILLRDGQITKDILDTSIKNNEERHPRTILATKHGKLYIMTVDGRQEGYSDGMRLCEAARFLQTLGMEQAINIDGGGSTTYYVRQPGEKKPKLRNKPSDGHERPVGNGVFIISKANQEEELAGITLSPSGFQRIVPGSKMRFLSKGYDRHYNPIAVEPNMLKWEVYGGIGSIDKSGLFYAGTSETRGHIIAKTGNISELVEVLVTDKVVELELSPKSFVIEAGRSQHFSVKAYDKNRNELIISPDVLDWRAEGDIGEVSPDGILLAQKAGNSGKIIAQYGDVVAEAIVHVGMSPIIEEFEDENSIRGRGVRTVPDSVNLTIVSDPEPVFGEYVAKLTYDFTGTEGTSAAYIDFLDKDGNTGREVMGEPKQLGMWVYGDEKFHWLRLGVTDGNGKNSLWNMTTVGGVNWKGWKYVYAVVPEDTVFPIKVRYIALEEKNINNKTAGVLYYDQFHAIYTDKNHLPNLGLIVEDYIRSGDIQDPLAKQINNQLECAKHFINEGSIAQTINSLDKILDILEDSSMEEYITSDVKEIIKQKTKKLLNFYN